LGTHLGSPYINLMLVSSAASRYALLERGAVDSF